MIKKVIIELEKEVISITYNDILKNHRVQCIFSSLNIYQIALEKLIITDRKGGFVDLTSTELRKINIHTLTKRSINLINSYINLDKQTATKKLNFLYKTDVVLKSLLKDLHKTKKIENRNIFLAKFSYAYIQTCLTYERNITKVLSKNTEYSQGYIKNIIKECFQKGYLKKSSKGVSGGVLSPKSISYLKQLSPK